jgi:Xaa-Pro aminopeptidase
MLSGAGVRSGKLGIYGQLDMGRAYGIFSELQRLAPDLKIIGEPGYYSHSVLLEAMATKDAWEVERIRAMGKITVDVVGNTADFLSGHRVSENTLIKPGGDPLTVGDVKARINLWLAERGAENPEGTIFSTGRDSAIPHSMGEPAAPLQLGQTIVFDIFPQEAGGGYFFDFTRTWCLGYAPEAVLALYEDVSAVYDQILSELKVGVPARSFQERACDLFEARGHPSVKSQPRTADGYVHGLGHGLGLFVHEHPLFLAESPETEVLAAGNVVTIEPGLYYPARDMAVRLEDTIWIGPDGGWEILAPYSNDLVIPVG